MNNLEKRRALEQVWNNWTGDITNEEQLMELEYDMHQVLRPNRRELNILEHDSLINRFICEKTEELDESHERITFPNSYYGAPL